MQAIGGRTIVDAVVDKPFNSRTRYNEFLARVRQQYKLLNIKRLLR